MMATAALTSYQHKASKRSQLHECALSQESIASMVSSLSVESNPPYNHLSCSENEAGEIASQDEYFSTATEGTQE